LRISASIGGLPGTMSEGISRYVQGYSYGVEANGQFYASAPLRYHRHKGRPVDVGSLCIYDDKPRDSFDAREQDIMLRLANMLVYQLATLVSSHATGTEKVELMAAL
jgi:GAF domain-containing protein